MLAQYLLLRHFKQVRIEVEVLLETRSNKMLLYIPKNQLSVNV